MRAHSYLVFLILAAIAAGCGLFPAGSTSISQEMRSVGASDAEVEAMMKEFVASSESQPEGGSTDSRLTALEAHVRELTARLIAVEEEIGIVDPGDDSKPDPDHEPFSMKSRRVYFLNCYGGHHSGTEIEPNDNLLGLNPAYRGVEGVDWADRRIRAAYEKGFRRVWINRPTGQVRGSDVPANAWAPMSTEKRTRWAQVLLALEHELPDLKIYVFVGATGYSLQDPRGANSANPDVPRWVGSEPFRTATLDNWLALGVDGFGIDTGSERKLVMTDDGVLRTKRELTLELSREYADRGIYIIGETVPVDGAPGSRVWDDEALRGAAWVATLTFFETRDELKERDFSQRAIVGDHEVFVWMVGPWTSADALRRASYVDEYESRGIAVITDDLRFAPGAE